MSDSGSDTPEPTPIPVSTSQLMKVFWPQEDHEDTGIPTPPTSPPPGYTPPRRYRESVYPSRASAKEFSTEEAMEALHAANPQPLLTMLQHHYSGPEKKLKGFLTNILSTQYQLFSIWGTYILSKELGESYPALGEVTFRKTTFLCAQAEHLKQGHHLLRMLFKGNKEKIRISQMNYSFWFLGNCNTLSDLKLPTLKMTIPIVDMDQEWIGDHFKDIGSSDSFLQLMDLYDYNQYLVHF